MDSWAGPVADAPEVFPVSSTKQQFHGQVWDIATDDVEFADQTTARDYMVHSGAVAVVALNDAGEVYLLRQYRHPVSMALFELPAGLLDIAGENALATAKRELAEEAGLEAADWHLITDFFPSPGGSSESIRLYLARGVSERVGGRVLTGEAEEVDLPGIWVPLDEAANLVVAGKISNAIAMIGILTTARLRQEGWKSLRSADEPWVARDRLLTLDRVRSGRFEHG